MSQFSITEARKYASATYGKHLIVLLKASALVGISLWLCSAAPEDVAQKLGVTQSVFSVDWNPLAESIQGDFELNFTAGMFLAKYAVFSVWGAIQAVPFYVLIIIFSVWLLVWALQLFLLVGFMNLCLHIKDNESGSLDLLFKPSRQQVIRIVGGIIVLILSAIVMLQVTPLLLMLFSTPKIFWGMLLLGMIFPCLWAWYVRGVFFYPLCIIDMPTSGVRNAVRLSKKISRGHFFRIWAAFMMMMCVVLVEAFILLIILALVISFFNGGASFNLKVHPGIIAFCFYPFCFLYYSFIYRALNPVKQSEIDKNLSEN